jgi:hypothetical protein
MSPKKDHSLTALIPCAIPYRKINRLISAVCCISDNKKKMTAKRIKELISGFFLPIRSDSLPVGRRAHVFARPRNVKKRAYIEESILSSLTAYTPYKVVITAEVIANINLP